MEDASTTNFILTKSLDDLNGGDLEDERTYDPAHQQIIKDLRTIISPSPRAVLAKLSHEKGFAFSSYHQSCATTELYFDLAVEHKGHEPSFWKGFTVFVVYLRPYLDNEARGEGRGSRTSQPRSMETYTEHSNLLLALSFLLYLHAINLST